MVLPGRASFFSLPPRRFSFENEIVFPREGPFSHAFPFGFPLTTRQCLLERWRESLFLQDRIVETSFFLIEFPPSLYGGEETSLRKSTFSSTRIARFPLPALPFPRSSPSSSKTTFRISSALETPPPFQQAERSPPVDPIGKEKGYPLEQIPLLGFLEPPLI